MREVRRMSLDLDLLYYDFNLTMDKSNRYEIYEFERFRLDAVHLMLYRDAEEIPLAPKAVETLLVLVERRGEILSKDELIETIWTDAVVEESNLAKYLHILRKTLGNRQNGKPFIETFRRRGYRFNGEISVGNSLPEAEPEKKNQIFVPFHAPTSSRAIREASTGNVVALADWRNAEETGEKLSEINPPAAQEADGAKKNPSSNGTKFPLAAAVGLLVLVSGFFAFTWFRSAPTPTTAAPIAAVAILPFENGSGNADLDYLSDGLSESLIDRLSALPQLKVIARSSTFKYRGQNIDLQNVANKLGVQVIVLGRVVQRGDDLSIHVEMVDARENKQLWGEQFNRKTTDALAVQQEIAQAVSEKLYLRLSGAQQRRLAKQETVDPQAYELLLKGVFFARKGGTENRKKAIEYYEQAIAVDPNYAIAYLKLSRMFYLLSSGGTLDPNEYLPKAQAAAQKALELDENFGEAHLPIADLKTAAWDWAAAETEYKRAIELNPNSPAVYGAYSEYLTITGRHDQALEAAKHAQELDPLSLHAILRIGSILSNARRHDEAIAEFGKVLEIDRNFIFTYSVLGFAYTGKGMYREAIAAYEEAIRLGNKSPSAQIYLGTAYARAGERTKAQAILRQLETSKEYVSPTELAALYGALGEREKAFTSLEKAYAARDLQLQYLKVNPNFDALRDDPRFADLVRRIGLPF
jgi:TolB-like protein/DNA-binding winged helix-turn-helix (wHTH) protein/Tfp pilus assembly protein PilF